MDKELKKQFKQFDIRDKDPKKQKILAYIDLNCEREITLIELRATFPDIKETSFSLALNQLFWSRLIFLRGIKDNRVVQSPLLQPPTTVAQMKERLWLSTNIDGETREMYHKHKDFYCNPSPFDGKQPYGVKITEME